MNRLHKPIRLKNNKNKEKSGFNLQGKILVAMPGLRDKRYAKTVILISEYNDDGTKGFIINQINPNIDYGEMMRQVNIKADDPPSPDIYAGGPVDPMRGFVLHSRDRQYRGSVMINGDMAHTSSLEPLTEIANHIGPLKRLVIVGHQVWGKGEVEKEIKNNKWLIMNHNMPLIFDCEPHQKWKQALKDMKISPSNLLNEVGLS